MVTFIWRRFGGGDAPYLPPLQQHRRLFQYLLQIPIPVVSNKWPDKSKTELIWIPLTTESTKPKASGTAVETPDSPTLHRACMSEIPCSVAIICRCAPNIHSLFFHPTD